MKFTAKVWQVLDDCLALPACLAAFIKCCMKIQKEKRKKLLLHNKKRKILNSVQLLIFFFFFSKGIQYITVKIVQQTTVNSSEYCTANNSECHRKHE